MTRGLGRGIVGMLVAVAVMGASPPPGGCGPACAPHGSVTGLGSGARSRNGRQVQALLFRLTHEPVGAWGAQWDGVQRAADTVWAVRGQWSWWALAHHPVGALGRGAMPAQRAVDVLWGAGAL